MADIALWRLDGIDRAGIADPVAALVLGPRPLVDTLLVGGRVVISGGELQTGDEGTIARDLVAQTRRLGERAGVARMSTVTGVRSGVGESVRRPDGIPKVKGEFAYASDLWADRMLWGSTLRSPHPRAKIRSIDIGPALEMSGVLGVLTHEDVPGRKTYGLEIPDQPVLAWEDVRYQGEAVAIVAADHPETARAAAAAIEVEYEVLEALTDPERALDPSTPPLHPSGNLLRHVQIEHGDPAAEGEVVVTGEYEVGMQDQAFLGPESGLAVPAEDGGVDLYIATQWLHVDQDQLAASLDLPPEKIRLMLGGVGGAFGGREDLSMQVHACMLALHTGRPVKMMYGREESFFGHIHRHPARMRYEHHATRDGRLVAVRARVLLDGGAYASSSTAVCSNAASFACGPYDVPNALIDAYVVYTDNPPCGAMRGFGAVQTCFAHEAQMDRLAAELGMDPVELRRRNALATGMRIPTGAEIRCPAPVEELLERVSAMPMPPERGELDLRELPGGVSNVTHGEGVRRGDRLRGRLQEHRLLRGLRRLLDRARARVAGARRAARRGPHRGRRGRAGPGHGAGADRAHRARRGSRRSCCRRTPASAPLARPRRRARR